MSDEVSGVEVAAEALAPCASMLRFSQAVKPVDVSTRETMMRPRQGMFIPRQVIVFASAKSFIAKSASIENESGGSLIENFGSQELARRGGLAGKPEQICREPARGVIASRL